MGKGKITLPPLDDSIVQASGDDKNDEVKPGLIPIKSHENSAYRTYRMYPKINNPREWLFTLLDKEPTASNEKSEEETDLIKKK